MHEIFQRYSSDHKHIILHTKEKKRYIGNSYVCQSSIIVSNSNWTCEFLLSSVDAATPNEQSKMMITTDKLYAGMTFLCGTLFNNYITIWALSQISILNIIM